MNTSTKARTHYRFQPGHQVIALDTFCSDCGSNTGPLPGTVVAHATDAEGESIALSDGLTGPYYMVDLDHEHSNGRMLVYAQCELEDAAIYELDRRHWWAATTGDSATEETTRVELQQRGLAVGCIGCGAPFVDVLRVAGVSEYPAGWLCAPCAHSEQVRC